MDIDEPEPSSSIDVTTEGGTSQEKPHDETSAILVSLYYKYMNKFYVVLLSFCNCGSYFSTALCRSLCLIMKNLHKQHPRRSASNVSNCKEKSGFLATS